MSLITTLRDIEEDTELKTINEMLEQAAEFLLKFGGFQIFSDIRKEDLQFTGNSNKYHAKHLIKNKI